jgi:DNA-binding SARP family transcriptional activator
VSDVAIRLLGAVQVWVDGRVIAVGPARRCAVLAALAVDAGRVVSLDQLADRVWGADPPARARRGLHAYVTRLRQVLAEADPDQLRLDRRPGGYVLRVDADAVDAHRFTTLVEQARAARNDSDRAALLDTALGLWQGPPLADLSGVWAESTREVWQQQRLDAHIAWVAAQLALGRPELVIGPLRALAREHPLVEPIAAALVRALYQTGRAAEALDCYAQFRHQLVEELGAEPGKELRRLHQLILRGEPVVPPGEPAMSRGEPVVLRGETVVARRGPVVPTPAPDRLVPRQLPATVAYFTGRAVELAALDRLLDRGAGIGAAVISAIGGTAGVGKTTLAVHWAHRVADRFPDGQLYLNLRGFDPDNNALDPADAIRHFLDALGVSPHRIPDGIDALAGLFRSRLADRRMILVLDNVRDSAQARPLIPAAPGCLVVVTSRRQLTGLIADGAQPVPLDLLSDDEARQLLARRLGPDRIDAEPEATKQIIDRCARLPLALAVAAARAVNHPKVSLRLLADGLGKRRWRTLSDDSARDVRAVFASSYRSLAADAASLFRLLALHPGPDVSAAAMVSLAGQAPEQTQAALAELVQAHLVTETSPGRYIQHDLLRAYAGDLGRDADPEPLRREALHRMLDHYLHSSYSADRWLNPARVRVPLAPPKPGVRVEEPPDFATAEGWFAAEHAVLLAAVDCAWDHSFDVHAWQLALSMWSVAYQRARWHDLATVSLTAVAAATRLADPSALGHAHRQLGRAYAGLNRLTEATAELTHAIEYFRRVGYLIGQAHAHSALSLVLESQRRLVPAVAEARRALELFRVAGHPSGAAIALNQIGWFSAQLGQFELAAAHCGESLAIHRWLDNQAGQGTTLDSLGYIHHGLGDRAKAIEYYQLSLGLRRALHDQYDVTRTLVHLGQVLDDDGQPEPAREMWRQALAILEDLEHPDAEQVRSYLAGGFVHSGH